MFESIPKCDWGDFTQNLCFTEQCFSTRTGVYIVISFAIAFVLGARVTSAHRMSLITQ